MKWSVQKETYLVCDHTQERVKSFSPILCSILVRHDPNSIPKRFEKTKIISDRVKQFLKKTRFCITPERHAQTQNFPLIQTISPINLVIKNLKKNLHNLEA